MADYEAGREAFNAGNYTSAFVEWRIAGGKGDARSQYDLARLYEEGLGVPQNFVHAHAWYNLAAGHGLGEARAARDDLAKRMTPDQLARAQGLVLTLISGKPSTEGAPPQAATPPPKETARRVPPARPAFKVTEVQETHVALEHSNVRAGPGKDFGRVGRLAIGEEVAVTGRVVARDWYRIALADGRAGYVYAPLLKARPSEPAPRGPGPVELALWNSVKGSFKEADLQSYLTRYPSGAFVGAARARIESVSRTRAAERIVTAGEGSPSATPPSADQGAAPEGQRAALSVDLDLDGRWQGPGTKDSGGRFDECVFTFGAYVRISFDIRGSKITGKVSKIVGDTSRKRAGVIFQYRIKGSVDATGQFKAAGGKVELNGTLSEDGERGSGTWTLPACRGTFKVSRRY